MPKKNECDFSNKEIIETLLELVDLSVFGCSMRGILHELSNIIGPILTDSELLAGQSGLPDSAKRLVDNIAGGAQRSAEFYRVLRRTLRQDDRRLKPTVLESAIDYALGICQRKIPANIKLEVDIPDTSTEVLSNKTLLVVLVYHLLQNAIEAIGDAPGVISVNIKCSESSPDDVGKWVNLSISDDGQGMDDEMLQRCRRPLVTDKDDHFGLGLTAAYEVAARRGSLSIESSVGNGTTIAATFPCFG